MNESTAPAPHCPKCLQPVEPHTVAVPGCTVCVRYASLRGNARKSRRDGHAPGLEMTVPEFGAWFVRQNRTCRYCTIPEHLIEQLGVLTQVGRPLRRLGIDRLDATLPYQIGNIGLCCFACNKVKSNTFDTTEMVTLGIAVAAVWHQRLLTHGIDWSAPPRP